MVNKKLAFVCVGTLVSLAGAAYADPAWCGKPDELQQGSLDSPNDLRGDLLAVAYLKCHPREQQDLKKTEAAYQRLNKTMRFSDADWADVADLSRARDKDTVRLKVEQAAWTPRDAIEQYATFVNPVLIVPGHSGEMDKWYLADIFGTKLSQAGRLGLVERCIKSDKPAEWAMCQADIDALDFAKLGAEIRADKTHSGANRMTVRLVAIEVQAELEKHAAEVAKLRAKDAAWKKVFAIAAKESKDWEARYRDKADLIALAAAMDDGLASGSRKATAGCKDTTWEQLGKAIRAIPAKEFVLPRKKGDEETLWAEQLIDLSISKIIGDPDGFLAANAYLVCHTAEQSEDILRINLQTQISRWAGFRGPRTGTMTRMILAQIQLDDRNEQIEYPALDRFWLHDEQEAGQTIGGVATMKPKGDKVTISYTKHLVKATYMTGCTQGRFVGFRGNGSAEYERNCTGHVDEMIDRRPNPEDIEARYAKELKPGMQSMIRKGALFMAWPKENAPLPIIVLGQPVK